MSFRISQFGLSRHFVTLDQSRILFRHSNTEDCGKASLVNIILLSVSMSQKRCSREDFGLNHTISEIRTFLLVNCSKLW